MKQLLKSFLRYSILLFLLLDPSCGADTSTAATISIKMLGVDSIPNGANGTFEPQSETFVVQKITMQGSDGKIFSLYDASPQSFLIINRPQIIFSGNLASEYDGNAYSNLTVVFASGLTANSLFATNVSLTLQKSSVVLSKSFTIVKGKDYNFDVNVAWGNTVTRVNSTDTISAPTLSLSVEQ